MTNTHGIAETNLNLDKVNGDTSAVDASSSQEEKIDSVAHSLVFRAMILFQVLAYGSYSVLVHLCKSDGVIMFSSVSMNLVLEGAKLLFSLITCFLQSSSISIKSLTSGSSLKKSLPYSIPGLLYFINNNLAVHMQLYMDPASYQILSNFKIVTTAILYRIIIKKKLSRQQWLAVSLLFFGGFFYSIGKNLKEKWFRLEPS